MGNFEGHTIMAARPTSQWRLLLMRTAKDGSQRWVWDKEPQRHHKSLAEAYDAMGFPCDQIPSEPSVFHATKT